MTKNENESLLFHSPNAVSRLSLWTTIVAWVVLVLGLFAFADQAYSIIKNWASISSSLPANLFDKLAAFANLFLDGFKGVVYFLTLRALSVGLQLLQDLFYGNTEDDEFIEEVIVEEPAK